MRVAKGKSATTKDLQAVALFREELRLMADLEHEGHTRNCAKFQVFESHPCTCPRRFGPTKKGAG